MLVVRSALSLRIVLLLLVLGAALYAAGLSIYLTLSVGRAAASLGEGAEAVVYQLEDLTHRHHALDRAVTEAHRALDWPAAPDASALRLIRTLAAAGGTRSRAVAFAKMPEVMRVKAARTDERMSRLGDTLTEIAALADLGRRGAAREQLRAADSLHDLVDESLAASGDLARADLLDRQRALQAATTRASRVGHPSCCAACCASCGPPSTRWVGSTSTTWCVGRSTSCPTASGWTRSPWAAASIPPCPRCRAMPSSSSRCS